jgi:hypothetical protein
MLISIPQAAQTIGRGVSFVYELITDGRIKAVKSDSRTLVIVSSLADYVANLPPAKINMSRPRIRAQKQKSDEKRSGVVEPDR